MPSGQGFPGRAWRGAWRSRCGRLAGFAAGACACTGAGPALGGHPPTCRASWRSRSGRLRSASGRVRAGFPQLVGLRHRAGAELAERIHHGRHLVRLHRRGFPSRRLRTPNPARPILFVVSTRAGTILNIACTASRERDQLVVGAEILDAAQRLTADEERRLDLARVERCLTALLSANSTTSNRICDLQRSASRCARCRLPRRCGSRQNHR